MYVVCLKRGKAGRIGAALENVAWGIWGNIIRGLLSAGMMKCMICKVNGAVTKARGQAVKIIQSNNESSNCDDRRN